MDLFNFLYKLSNIFTNKRRLKFFIVLGLIIVFVFVLHSKGFCSTSQDDETLMLYQLQLQENFIQYMRRLYQNKPNGFDQSAFNNICTRLLYYQTYVTIPTGDTNCLYWVYFYEPNNSVNNPNIFNIDGTFSVGLNSGTEIDCKLGNITCAWSGRVYQSGGGRTTPIYSTTSTSTYIPSAMYMVRSTYITEFLEDIGYFPSLATTFSTNDEELQAINQQGFEDVTSGLSDVNDSINNVENTLTDTATDDNQVAFVSESNEDITSGIFTYIYNQLKNSLSSQSAFAFQLTIPFTNKSFTISNNYLRNNFQNNSLMGSLPSLIERFWWFVLGIYIAKDIYKKINKIKSGDLTNIENENITTELL